MQIIMMYYFLSFTLAFDIMYIYLELSTNTVVVFTR
jgi:hypothetical protein